jgi:hypothetical protein
MKSSTISFLQKIGMGVGIAAIIFGIYLILNALKII